MIFRKYQMRVTNKREMQGDYREIVIEPEPADFAVPYWIARAPMGSAATLQVAPDEFNDIEVGDLVTINITIGDC